MAASGADNPPPSFEAATHAAAVGQHPRAVAGVPAALEWQAARYHMALNPPPDLPSHRCPVLGCHSSFGVPSNLTSHIASIHP